MPKTIHESNRLRVKGSDAFTATKGSIPNLLLLCFVVLAVFGNSLRNEFVWDDIFEIVGNPVYINFDIGKILFSSANGFEYLPVRDLSLSLDYLIWGRSPMGFHLSNVLLYCLNVIVVYYLTLEVCFLLAKKQGDEEQRQSRRTALVAALLFAVHPIHCEVVNWVSCRNALLSGLYFLAACCYLRYLRSESGQGRLYYAGALLSFTLGLLSKATVIIFPALLFLFIAYKKELNKMREALYTGPFFLMAGAAFFIHMSFARTTTVIKDVIPGASGAGFASKVAVALQIPLFYLGKIIIFFRDYSAAYSDDEVAVFPKTFTDPPVIVTSLILAGLLCLALLLRKKHPHMLFGLAFFLLTIIPVLHIFPTYPIVADRYAYLPSYGVFYLMAVFLTTRAGSWGKGGMAIIAVIVITWAVISYGQNQVWKSSLTLWENAVRIKPTMYAYKNLAKYYYRHGEFEKGRVLSLKAAELDPANPMKLSDGLPDPWFVLGGNGR